MRLSQRHRFGINWVVLCISILAWVILLVNPGHIMSVEHCHVSASGSSAKSLKMLLQMNPFSNLLMGWLLMVVAMMLPKLIMPIHHIYLTSLKRNRILFSILFVLGYMSIWMIVGVLMTAIILGFNLLMPLSFVPAVAIGLVAIVWQFSPVKQQFLNRGHDHWILPVFGWPAVKSVTHFGLMHGVWCVGAGWAIMLFPMLLPNGHNLAMLIVTFIMISEHMEHPKFPAWHLSFRLKLLRIIIAQTRIKLKQVLNAY